MRNLRVYCLLGTLVLGGMIPAAPAMAYGEAGRWSKGWGQGTTEYAAVVDEQNQLYIACNDMRKVSMTATVNDKQYGSYAEQGFAIVIDGQRFDEPYETESHVGENNFFYLWDKMRSAKTVAIETADAQQLALPIQDAASVLPATQSADFGCLTWDKAATEAPAPAPAPESMPTPTQVSAALSPSTFDVSWRIEDVWVNTPAKMLKVVSHSDSITIQNAVINRGNCPNNPLRKLPLALRFGQSARFAVHQNCNILELQLVTNQGEVFYQFDSQS